MKQTILVVDDEKINIDLLLNFLRVDYNVMAAISGGSTIELLSRRKPDLVLLDLYMPDMNGFEVLQYMKEHDELSNIPVIFVTGERDEYSEERGLSLGAVDYIKKPYNTAIVGVKVRNHLEMKLYRDDLESLVRKRTKQLEERSQQLAASREAIIMGMSLMSESHDRVTGDHIERIKVFTKILAEKILELYPDMLTRELADQIILFSTLHDVGKVSISDTILRKTGILTSEEFQIMKSHTLEGGELLRKTDLFLVGDRNENNLNVAVEIAEFHHERFDGSGYPHGLKQEEIPISARIVSLADVYDALRSARPYKKAFTHEDTYNIIVYGDNRTSPKHFDPRILEAFKLVQNEFSVAYTQNSSD